MKASNMISSCLSDCIGNARLSSYWRREIVICIGDALMLAESPRERFMRQWDETTAHARHNHKLLTYIKVQAFNQGKYGQCYTTSRLFMAISDKSCFGLERQGNRKTMQLFRLKWQ